MTEHVVIVGGTSGIGLATAARLVDGGHEMVITERDPVKLSAALEQLGTSVTGQRVDARDRKALDAFPAGLGCVLGFSL